MAGARSSARDRGKSDVIDAVAIARAAIREGLDTLPVAQLAGPALRERLIGQRTALINDLRWQLHDLSPEEEIPLRVLIGRSWQERVARRLVRGAQTARVRIARDELRRVRELSRAIAELERELAELVAALAPQLLAEQGCGVLTAAKLIGEIAGAERFTTDAKLARLAGAAPIPDSSANTSRHRLDRSAGRSVRVLAVPAGAVRPSCRHVAARLWTVGFGLNALRIPAALTIAEPVARPRRERAAPVSVTAGSRNAGGRSRAGGCAVRARRAYARGLLGSRPIAGEARRDGRGSA